MRTKLTLGRKTLSRLQPARDHHLQQLVRRPVPEPGSSCLLHHPIALSYQSGYLSTVSIMGCRTHYGLLLSVLVPAAVLVAPDWARADKSPGEAWRRAEMLKRPKGGTLGDPNPRVVLIAGLGLVAAAKNAIEANLSRDFVYRAINVIRGAHALGALAAASSSSPPRTPWRRAGTHRRTPRRRRPSCTWRGAWPRREAGAHQSKHRQP